MSAGLPPPPPPPPVDGEDRLGEAPFIAAAAFPFKAGPACTSGVVELSSSGQPKTSSQMWHREASASGTQYEGRAESLIKSLGYSSTVPMLVSVLMTISPYFRASTFASELSPAANDDDDDAELLPAFPLMADGSTTVVPNLSAFNSSSRHRLHTRTGLSQPRLGTRILCLEHALQNPSPQFRQ